MKKTTIVFGLILSILTIAGQVSAQDGKPQGGHYKVEQKFEPKQADVINNFVGKTATPFIASDMENVERYLTDYKAQACAIYFWNLENPESLALLPVLNEINKGLKNKAASIISMADDPRQKVQDYLATNPINFPNIPNAKMLSEAMYGAELGYPRVFILDEYQTVRAIITPDQLSDIESARVIIEKFITKYLP